MFPFHDADAMSSELPEGDRGATGGSGVEDTDEESWDLVTEFAFMLSNLIPLLNQNETVEVEALKRFLFCYDTPYTTRSN